MPSVFKDFPVITLTIFFTLGIFTFTFLNIPIIFLWSIFLLGAIGLFIFLRSGNKTLFDICLLVLFFILGGLVLRVGNLSGYQTTIEQLKQKEVRAAGYVVSDPEIRNNYAAFDFKLEKLSFEGKGYDFKNLHLRTYFWGYHFLRYGQKISCQGKIKKNKSGRYVFYASSVSTKGRKTLNPLKSLSYYFRNRAKDSFFINFPKREAAFLSALFLGKREYLQDEDYLSFQKTGTTHILSISGLHTAVFVTFFNFIFMFLGLKRKPRYVVLATLLILWIFFSGLRIPVIRATLIALCFFAGSMLERRLYLLNSIFLSALLILLFKPTQLFGVSFQLSYVCVLSIVIFIPLLSRSKLKSKVLNFIRDTALVSGVLFLATAGLVSYYFGMVSFISVLANVFLVPLLFVILVLCFMFFIPFSLMQAGVQSLLSLVIFVFNSINNFLGNLSFSHAYVKLSLKGCLLYYLLFCSLLVVYFVVNKRRPKEAK